ncbi:M16 family metallopeptidase [Qipengyuania nanhaisediminis]|uniref:Predicted Zn-dependent peptidase n=1 Tax=Qipengyuania nanhaisediminis TaxID=604088 RepID=A0A1I5NK74_9SPHN|nr:pitrilysin family protein [Qipengyuania nanhaisediminis]SFP22060.1 Predicted Zn-dependent peptidase [Qipengyuania nanhaisediminis]
MKRIISASVIALAVSACSTYSQEPVDTASIEAAVTEQAVSYEPAPLSQLVAEVDIPYDKFVLDNGLTVVVHEDRKAPLVGVSVWYDVGSKHEPKGKTGFAHLFEHLMFNGTENAPEDWFEYIQQMGGTDVNGTTNPDRTNYFQTVPTGALDRVLMLESDRMGHLLDAVTQEKLDNQRGVVQNEKRQGDNNPFGLLRYEIFENLFPKGHRYHHSTIGSMGDLDAATMDDVRNWFIDHYGPNNAVLVLAGDIDTATAREKVQKWFGDIERGPEVVHPAVDVPTLAEEKTKVTTDQISTTRLYRMWTVPGSNSAESVPMNLASAVLGGLSSSRLDNSLVREDPVAVSVSTFNYTLEDAGIFVVQADVKPGVDPDQVATKLDAQIADFLATGPTEDELQRAKVSTMAGVIRGLESVGGFGGKAPQLASGELFANDPGYVERQLDQMAAATPEQVHALARKWLSRPVFNLVFNPGERTEGGEDRGGAVTGPDSIEDIAQANYCAEETCDLSQIATQAQADRDTLPELQPLQGLDFPDIERATLSNGMEVYFAHRDAVPTVSVRVEFDAGRAAETAETLGTQRLLLSTMGEGTERLDATDYAIAQERLGANIFNGFDADYTNFSLAALAPNLAPSLELLAETIRQPGLRANVIERERAQLLNALSSELKNPNSIADRTGRRAIFGPHPYGLPTSGLGSAARLEALTEADLRAFHATWLRPDNARIFVVGDTSLAEVTRLLEASFGDWQAPATAKPERNYSAAIPEPRQRIILVNRPNSPQSVIYGGQVLGLTGRDDLIPLIASNEALGGGFLARINMNLREEKGWSYGAGSQIASGLDRVFYGVRAPVQSDRTGDSISEIRREINDFVDARGVQPNELERIVNSNMRELPGQFETAGDVLGGLVNIVRYDRPDDYYETLASRYNTLTASQLDLEARRNINEGDIVYIVVGDAEVVAPQLDTLGLEVEVIEPQE